VSKNKQAILWAVAAAIVAQFGMELSAGNVPVPAQLRWVIPLIVAGISAFSPYLKR